MEDVSPHECLQVVKTKEYLYVRERGGESGKDIRKKRKAKEALKSNQFYD